MRLISTCLALCLLPVTALAQASDDGATAAATPDSTRASQRNELFFDPEDGQLDLSGYLNTARGFLPLGNVITEPAIGYGASLGLIFIKDSIADRAARVRELDPDGTLKRLPPPSAMGVMGFATSSNSWGAGAFYNGIFLEDRLRYLGVGFYSELELEYFGPGGEFQLPIDKIEYSLDGYVILQEAMARVADTNVFFGANYQFMSFNNQLNFDTDLELPDVLTQPRNIKAASLGVIAQYDTRNTTFTPDKGLNGRMEADFFEKALGSDRNFFKAQLRLRGWVPLKQRFVLGLRWDSDVADDSTPFYMLPSIGQRGISRTRFQGQFVTTTEAELRWDFTRRWSLLGFLGSGWAAATDLEQLRMDDAKIAGGTGFRYLISRVFGLRMGTDFAWSEDDFAFYIVAGSAWGR